MQNETGIAAPHDEQAERFVLGYAMLLGIEPLSGLEPRHFFFDANGIIFAALQDGAKGPHGVAEYLKAAPGPSVHWGNFLRVGGGGYLAELVLEVDTSWTGGKDALALHATACGASVIEQWKRRVIRSAALGLAVALCGNLNSADAWSTFRETCRAAVG